MDNLSVKKRAWMPGTLAVGIATFPRRSTRYGLRAICICAAILVAHVGCGPTTEEVRQQECQAKADIFKEHVVSAEFTVEETDRLIEVVSECEPSVYSMIGEAAAPEPSMETYEGRLATLVAYRAAREAERERLKEAQEKVEEERRQRVAAAQASPGCAKARAEYQEFRPADAYSRYFYDRNVLPVACRAEAAEDPDERMQTQEERVAEQLELLRAGAKTFMKVIGVSERCAGIHLTLALEQFKADRGWVPLLTDDRMTTYYSASSEACPSDYVIIDDPIEFLTVQLIDESTQWRLPAFVGGEVKYGSPGWEHCFHAPVKSFTLNEGAWRCESLAGIKAVDHDSDENFQEPDCHRSLVPIPADGGIKAMTKKYPSKYVSFCSAGRGLYARNGDFIPPPTKSELEARARTQARIQALMADGLSEDEALAQFLKESLTRSKATKGE